MTNQPLVSIICNVYNHGPYLRSALDGFVMQKTTFPFEVLVHDDASTDNSAEIIREYEKKFPDIIKPIYQTVNQYSQKIGINQVYQLPRVKGKYVAVCEGDDYWTDPMKLQKQFDFMETHLDYALCTCSTVWLDMRTGKQTNRCQSTVDKDVSLEEIILETHGRIFQYATVFAKAEVFVHRPQWCLEFGVGDTPIALYAATLGKVRMMADTMAVYRNNTPGSWTSGVSADTGRKKKAYLKLIEGFSRFNEATDGRYAATVDRRIKQLKYNIARLDRDWKALRSAELREIYRSRSFSLHVSDFFSCKAPALQNLFKKVRKSLHR